MPPLCKGCYYEDHISCKTYRGACIKYCIYNKDSKLTNFVNICNFCNVRFICWSIKEIQNE